MPRSNAELPRFAIPLHARPDLRDTLQAVLDVVGGSCPAGRDIVAALGTGNVQVLVFPDRMMDRIAGGDVQASQANVPGGSLLLLRESAIADSSRHFSLIRQVAHEGTHVVQRGKFPGVFGNRRHPSYVENTIAFEKEAFAGASEVCLSLGLQEAQAAARETGRPTALRETEMARDWKRLEPEEAEAALSAFEDSFPRTRDARAAINAAREATVSFFDRHHAADYRQQADAEARATRREPSRP